MIYRFTVKLFVFHSNTKLPSGDLEMRPSKMCAKIAVTGQHARSRCQQMAVWQLWTWSFGVSWMNLGPAGLLNFSNLASWPMQTFRFKLKACPGFWIRKRKGDMEMLINLSAVLKSRTFRYRKDMSINKFGIWGMGVSFKDVSRFISKLLIYGEILISSAQCHPQDFGLTAISSKQQTAQKERTHWHVYLMIQYIYYYLIVHIYIYMWIISDRVYNIF